MASLTSRATSGRMSVCGRLYIPRINQIVRVLVTSASSKADVPAAVEAVAVAADLPVHRGAPGAPLKSQTFMLRHVVSR